MTWRLGGKYLVPVSRSPRPQPSFRMSQRRLARLAQRRARRLNLRQQIASSQLLQAVRALSYLANLHLEMRSQYSMPERIH